MSVLEALVLGIVQGLTEFLPVSSSGHLVIAERLLGVSSEDITFEVATHFATLLAVLVFFYPVLKRIFLSPVKLFNGDESIQTARDMRLLLVIIVATIPAVLVGLLLKDQIEQAFASARMASYLLLLTSAIILSTVFARFRKKNIGFGNGMIVGLAQALAILPGISRSGSTISAALFCGVSRQEAFNFSFVLSVPAILGATLITLLDVFRNGVAEGWLVYLVAMVAAFVTGYLSLILLQKTVISGKFYLFGVYTLIVGLAGVIFF